MIALSDAFLLYPFVSESNSRCLAADRRAQFEKLEYTEADYQDELRHIEEVCNNGSVDDDYV
jgi:hypothetical protein